MWAKRRTAVPSGSIVSISALDRLRTSASLLVLAFLSALSTGRPIARSALLAASRSVCSSLPSCRIRRSILAASEDDGASAIKTDALAHAPAIHKRMPTYQVVHVADLMFQCASIPRPFNSSPRPHQGLTSFDKDRDSSAR